MHIVPNETHILPMTNTAKPVMKGTTLSEIVPIGNRRHTDKESAETGR